MKKILVLLILVVGLSTTTFAENVFISNNNREYFFHDRNNRNNRNNRHNNNNNRHNNNNHHNNNDRNNEVTISKDKLPSSITKYLEKNFPGYSIIESKQRTDGYFYLKIKYNQKAIRPYYRSLVFDQNGNSVKG